MQPADRYAVIGHPIAHSLSPRIHGLFAQQTHQHLVYTALDIEPGQLASGLRDFFANGGCGVNVTVPHKEAVIPLCDQLAERARSAGAVNTILRDSRDRLLGDNTDGIGLVRDLTRNLRLSVAGRRVLLLGAGGAARGVLAPLLALQPLELVVANRTVERALALAHTFSAYGPVRGAGYAQLDGSGFELIINATAASLHGQVPPLPPSVLGGTCICYDMVYGHAATPFVQWARAHGASQAHMGLGMLVEQAAESFFLWRGLRPDTAGVLAVLAAESADAG